MSFCSAFFAHLQQINGRQATNKQKNAYIYISVCKNGNSRGERTSSLQNQ